MCVSLFLALLLMRLWKLEEARLLLLRTTQHPALECVGCCYIGKHSSATAARARNASLPANRPFFGLSDQDASVC